MTAAPAALRAGTGPSLLRPATYPPRVERPAPPSLAPGRSALPRFLLVERRLDEEVRAAEEAAARAIEAAEVEARRVRSEGEARLKAVVLDAETQARREVEARARDRVSDARVRVGRWVESAEAASADAVERALELLTSDPIEEGGGG